MAGRLQDADYAEFVRFLVISRKDRGVSQVELAHRLGRPQSYVSKFERMERRLDIAEWRDIVLALGLPANGAFAEVSDRLDLDGLIDGKTTYSD